jgi:hypothetical protein
MDVTGKTVRALNGIPFGNLIGGPLSACIKAQQQAAMTTVNFIREVGLNTKTTTMKETVDGVDKTVEVEENEAIYVYFNFVQNGRKVNISVPLLTILPIPYIAINTVDISFKATINGTEGESDTLTKSYEKKEDETSKKRGLGWFKVYGTDMKTSISTKKDSTATKDSSYSIEATIDVAVHASQDSMPAGMAKVLELLGNAMDICDPNGELTVNDTEFYIEKDPVQLIVSYKTPQGLYVVDSSVRVLKSGGTEVKEERKTETEKIYMLAEAGKYEVKGGDSKTITVNVEKKK